MERLNRFLEARAQLLVLVGIVIAALVALNPNTLDFLGLRAPNFKVIAPPTTDSNGNRLHAPAKRGRPTTVLIRNHGMQEGPVRSVEFQVTNWYKTPQRAELIGEPISFPVVFTYTDYNKERGRFLVAFDSPQSIPAEGIGVFKIAIEIDEWVGHTAVGNFTVVYDDGERVTERNVEIDVLSSAQP
jgi:hypothetical protein